MRTESTPANGVRDFERSAERLLMVLRATREAVWDWDLLTNVVLWNEGLGALGYSAADVRGDAAWLLELIHPSDRERIRHGREQAADDERREAWEDEYQLVRPDGTYADVVDRAVIARDGSGRALRMVGALQDVTRRNQQLSEIHRLAGRLRDVASAARVGTWHFDAPTGLFHVDATLNHLMSREPVDTAESFDDVLRFVHPDDRARVLGARDDALAGLRPFAVEHRVVLGHGEIRWVRNRGRISLDNRGRVQTITGALADVTDLKHGEQSMALLADASRILAESLDAAQVLAAITRMVVPTFADGSLVHMKDPETGVVALAATHAADSELDSILRDMLESGTFRVGAPSHRVVRSGAAEIHAKIDADWLMSEDADERVIPLVRRYHVTSVIFVAIALDGAPIGVIVFFSTGGRFQNADLTFAEELGRRASHAMHNARLLETAKRERGRAEEAQVVRERLLAIVGHDLRNPLAAIAMAIQALRARDIGSTIDSLARRIESSAARMSRLIGEVLDFASIRQGMSLPIKFCTADLHEICRNVVDELRVGHPERNVALHLQGEPVVTCDADRIAEVVSNLVGNAIQHGADGPVDVAVREARHDRIAIEIHNLGAIPTPARETIFDAYRHEPSASDRRSNSIGLGLYIANEIVKAHHGMIELASTPAEGTTFTVLLPRRPPDRSSPT